MAAISFLAAGLLVVNSRTLAFTLIPLGILVAVAALLYRTLSHSASHSGHQKPPYMTVTVKLTGAEHGHETWVERQPGRLSGCVISRDPSGVVYFSVNYRARNVIVTGPPRKPGFTLTVPHFRRDTSEYPRVRNGIMGIELNGRGYGGFHTPGWRMTVRVGRGGRTGSFDGHGLVDGSGRRHVNVRGSWRCTSVGRAET